MNGSATGAQHLRDLTRIEAVDVEEIEKLAVACRELPQGMLDRVRYLLSRLVGDSLEGLCGSLNALTGPQLVDRSVAPHSIEPGRLNGLSGLEVFVCAQERIL